MDINGYWLAGSIIALFFIRGLISDMEKEEESEPSTKKVIAFWLLTAVAVVFMGLAFEGKP